MNALLRTKNVVRWLSYRRLLRPAYRGALVQHQAWRTERGLHALLWIGVICGVVVTVQQIFLQASMTSHSAMQLPPPPTENSALPPSLPATAMAQGYHGSLFSLPGMSAVETPPPVATDVQLVPVSSPDSLSVMLLPHWQIQVQSSMPETTALHALASAKWYLHSGKFALARPWLLDALRQDPHQAEALAGMLLVSRKMGDSDNEQHYLERLRQVMPDYVYADEAWLLSELE